MTLALMLLVLPMQWVFAAALAAAFHELCHYSAVRLCGGEMRNLRAGVTGVRMEVVGLSAFQELLCSLAGPCGSLLLLIAARWLPRTAVCAGFQGIYNLLPIYPLDGGRAFRCGAELLLSNAMGEKVCRCIEWMCLCALVLLGLYGTFFKGLGLLPLALAAAIALRTTASKNTLQTGRVFGTIE